MPLRFGYYGLLFSYWGFALNWCLAEMSVYINASLTCIVLLNASHNASLWGVYINDYFGTQQIIKEANYNA